LLIHNKLYYKARKINNMISLKIAIAIIISAIILASVYTLFVSSIFQGYFVNYTSNSYQSSNDSTTVKVSNLQIEQLKQKGISIYAVSKRASAALAIALSDPNVNEKLNSIIYDIGKGVDVSIIGVQPIELSTNTKIAGEEGKPIHHELLGYVLQPIINSIKPNVNDEMYNSGKYGEVVMSITYSRVDGNVYIIDKLDSIVGKEYEIRQEVWRIISDINEGKIINIMKEERLMKQKIDYDTIYMYTNVFMPNDVIIDVNKVLVWKNYSNMPHNVVGIYRYLDGTEDEYINSITLNVGDSWYLRFDRKGIFEYYCTYHADEGMRGKIIIN